MRSRIALATLAAFVLTGPALAKDKDSGDKQSQEAPKEKKICHTETVTGSLIAKRRICKTQAEWDAARSKRPRPISTIFTSRPSGVPGSGPATPPHPSDPSLILTCDLRATSCAPLAIGPAPR